MSNHKSFKRRLAELEREAEKMRVLRCRIDALERRFAGIKKAAEGVCSSDPELAVANVAVRDSDCRHGVLRVGHDGTLALQFSDSEVLTLKLSSAEAAVLARLVGKRPELRHCASARSAFISGSLEHISVAPVCSYAVGLWGAGIKFWWSDSGVLYGAVFGLFVPDGLYNKRFEVCYARGVETLADSLVNAVLNVVGRCHEVDGREARCDVQNQRLSLWRSGELVSKWKFDSDREVAHGALRVVFETEGALEGLDYGPELVMTSRQVKELRHLIAENRVIHRSTFTSGGRPRFGDFELYRFASAAEGRFSLTLYVRGKNDSDVVVMPDIMVKGLYDYLTWWCLRWQG